jgi:hypothetical protein
MTFAFVNPHSETPLAVWIIVVFLANTIIDLFIFHDMTFIAYFD